MEKQPVILANLLVSTRGSFVSGVHAPPQRRRSSVLRLRLRPSCYPAITPPRRRCHQNGNLALLTSPPVKGLNHPLIAMAMTQPHPRQNNGPGLMGSCPLPQPLLRGQRHSGEGQEDSGEDGGQWREGSS